MKKMARIVCLSMLLMNSLPLNSVYAEEQNSSYVEADEQEVFETEVAAESPESTETEPSAETTETAEEAEENRPNRQNAQSSTEGLVNSSVVPALNSADLRASFAPPAVGDIGRNVWSGVATSPETVREYMKSVALPAEIQKKISTDQVLGSAVGSVATTKIISKQLLHIYFDLRNPMLTHESWYGYITINNLKVEDASGDLEVRVEKDSLGEWTVTTKRLKTSKQTDYSLKLSYDYTFEYYSSIRSQVPGLSAQWSAWLASAINLSTSQQVVTIAAEPLNQELNALPASNLSLTLGESTKSLTAESLVQDVKLNNEVLDASQYTVTKVKDFVLDVVGEQSIQVQVSLNNNPDVTLNLSVPLFVKWGNAIVFGCYDYYDSGRTSAAFPLLLGTQPQIAAMQGNGNDNLPIHESFSKPYYRLDWFDLSNVDTTYFAYKLQDTSIGNRYTAANGTDLKQDALKQWGTNQIQQVNYGDIVRAWNLETAKNWLYVNEERQSLNQQREAVYYEVTESGYRPLHFNQLTASAQTLGLYTTQATLDANLSNYLSTEGLKDVAVTSFVTYPDTSKVGLSVGTIRVKETLASGKVIAYDYTIPFNIADNRELIATPVSQRINLGTNFSALDYAQFVKGVSYGGKDLAPSEYTVTPLSAISTAIITTSAKVTVRVALKTDPTISQDVSVPVRINLGNAIELKASDLRTVAGLAAFEESDGSLRIKAIPAIENANPINPSFAGDYLTLAIYPNAAAIENKNAPSLERTFQGTTQASAISKEFGEVAVNAGEILKISHVEVLKYPTMLNVYKNSLSTQPYKLYSLPSADTYYEITSDGYRLLLFNQLSPKEDVVVPYGADAEYLDAHVTDFLSKGNFTNVTILGFSEYPKTNQSGVQAGKIRVAETLASGETLAYDYPVKLTVEKTALQVETTDNLTFPLGTDFTKIDPQLFIKEVHLNGEVVPAESTRVTLTGIPTGMQIGSETATLSVALLDHSAEAAVIKVPVQLLWGSTIELDNIYYPGNSGLALSLIQESAGPAIVSTYGNNLEKRAAWINDASQNQTYFATKLFHVTAENVNQTISELTPYYVYEKDGKASITDNVMGFGTSGRLTVQLGDVVQQSVVLKKDAERFPDNNRLTENETFSYKNAGLEEVYYEVTTKGYQPLVFNQVPVFEQTFTTGTTQEEILRQITAYLKGLSSKLSARYVQAPDTSTAGEKTVVVKVLEQLQTGHFVSKDYTLKMHIVNNAGLQVTVQPQKIVLGTNMAEYPLKNLLKEVTYNGEILEESDYTVSMAPFSTDYIQSNSVTLTVGLQADEKITLAAKVPVEVIWGESLAIGSFDYVGGGRTAAAFTLHHGSSPYITAAGGINAGDNSAASANNSIHKNFNRKYYAFDWFDLSQSNSVMLNDATIGNAHVEGKGTENKAEVLARFGEQQRQSVHYGDVVRSWALESGKNYLIVNEEKVPQNRNDVYYEITTAGYRPLTLSAVTTKTNAKENLGVTKEELAQKITNYLNLPASTSYEVSTNVADCDTLSPDKTLKVTIMDIGDTSVAGTKTLQVVVAEKLATTANGQAKVLMKSIMVPYMVRSRITETFVAEDATPLAATKTTFLDSGASYTPTKENFLTQAGNLYRYKGYRLNNAPEELTGMPEKVTGTTVITYVYERADKYINVTFPAKLAFSTKSETNQQIISETYTIKNNSLDSQFGLKVMLSGMALESSSDQVELAQNAQDANGKLVLNLQLGNKEIDYLQTTMNAEMGQLAANDQLSFIFTGAYNGKLAAKEVLRPAYTLKLKFSMVESK